MSIDTCQEREPNNRKPAAAPFLGGRWLSIGRSETLGGEPDIALDLFMVYIWSEKEVPMKLSSQIKPISYLKAHAAEIVRTLGDQSEPLIITQNGEAKAVMQDIDSYEQMQETVALLKILALGSRQVEAGQVQPAADVVARLRERRRDR